MGAAACQTAGAKKETIKTENFAAELGWLDKAHTQVGEALTSESEPESGLLSTFSCGGLSELTATFAVGPYLGEVSPGYTPLVNQPAFEEGAKPVGVELTELKSAETGNEWAPAGGLPSGFESTIVTKGEKLEIG